jgi:hypothetical protein
MPWRRVAADLLDEAGRLLTSDGLGEDVGAEDVREVPRLRVGDRGDEHERALGVGDRAPHRC